MLHGRLLHSDSVPYPHELREHLVRTLPPAELRYADVCELDTHIGQAFAKVAADAIAASGPVDLICSHGQTVFHWVDGCARPGHAPAGRAGLDRGAHRGAGRVRRPCPGHHGRWPRRAARVAHGRAAAGRPAGHACRAQPGRHLQHDRAACGGRWRARRVRHRAVECAHRCRDASDHRAAPPATTRMVGWAPRGTSTRRHSRTC